MALLGNGGGSGGGSLLQADATTSLIGKTILQKDKFDNIKRQFFKYKKLHEEIIAIVETPLTNIVNANFEDLSNNLVAPLTNLGIALNTETLFQPGAFRSLRTYSYDPATFDLFRSHFHQIVDVLKQTSNLYKRKEGWKFKAKKNEDTLYDIDNLREFIKSYYKSFTLFTTSDTLTVTPEIKPQYVIYIERHGLPPGGCFESEKMSAIMIELIAAGTIPQIDLDNYLESFRVQQQQQRDFIGDATVFEPTDNVILTSSESGDKTSEDAGSSGRDSLSDLNSVTSED